MLGEGRQFDEVNDGAPSGRAQSDGGSLNHSYSQGLLALLPKVLFSLSALVVSVTASLIAWGASGPFGSRRSCGLSDFTIGRAAPDECLTPACKP